MTALLRLASKLLRRGAPQLFHTIQRLRSIYYLLDRPIKHSILALQLLMIVAAAFGILSTLSVVPFMMAVINRDVGKNKILGTLFDFVGVEQYHEILLFLGIGSLLLLVSSAICTLLVSIAIAKLNMTVRLSFFRKMFDYYLDESYEFHATKNSATLVHNIRARLGSAIQGIMQTIIRLNTSCILFALSIGGLLWINPIFAITSSILIFTLLFLVIKYSRRVTSQINQELVRKEGAINTALIESMRLHEDFTLVGRKRAISGQVDELNSTTEQGRIKLLIIGELFPTALELSIYGTLIAVMTSFAYFWPSQDLLVPMAVFALVLYRLKPYVVTFFDSYLFIIEGLANFDVINNDLVTSLQHTAYPHEGRRFPFASSIDFSDVSYCYPGVGEPALSQLSVSFVRGQHIGFCGPSGGGKSTLLKLALGFIRPSSGQLSVDGQELTQDNVLQWYNIIGYVSQSSRFTDGSIADNILLGRERGDEANQRIWHCLEMVQLKDFIETLPDHIDTLVGEDGIQLSGGQQQRLVIARALYAAPEILIFDEATSSLDYETEVDIMACIKRVFKGKTLLMVAHRLSTIIDSDILYFIEDGRLQAQGSYDELMAQSTAFQSLVKAGQKKERDGDIDTAINTASVPADSH